VVATLQTPRQCWRLTSKFPQRTIWLEASTYSSPHVSDDPASVTAFSTDFMLDIESPENGDLATRLDDGWTCVKSSSLRLAKPPWSTLSLNLVV
jgi:hypothetical protein